MIWILLYILIGVITATLGYWADDGRSERYELFWYAVLCPVLLPLVIIHFLADEEGGRRMKKFSFQTKLKPIHKSQFELKISFLGIDKLSKTITIYKDGEVWRDSTGYKFSNQEKLNTAWAEQEKEINERAIEEAERKEFLKREFEMRDGDF